jgi:hypothetical protein
MSATIIVASVAAVLLAGGGFVAGRATAPDTSEALAEQTAAIEAVAAGNTALVAEVQAVALAEAEREANIADKLTDIPPQCVRELGGNPDSLACDWAWCVRTGETDKKRCEQGKWTDARIKQHALDQREDQLDERERVLEVREAACPEPTDG